MPYGDPWRSRGQMLNDDMDYIMERLDRPRRPSPYLSEENRYAQDVPTQGRMPTRVPAVNDIPEIPVSATYRPEQIKYAPLMDKEADRRAAILNEAPATFDVHDNPGANSAEPGHSIGIFGSYAVNSNDAHIREAAAKANIDPDLLRSIMYVENAQGWYGALPDVGRKYFDPLYQDAISAVKQVPGLENVRFKPHVSETVFPANINPDTWAGLGLNEKNVFDPSHNIGAGAKLLGEIQERVADTNPSKVATLYNSLAKDDVSNYGARVARVMEEKPWEQSWLTRWMR